MMKLTIIEPHQHFGVLKKWMQVCILTKWKIQVISSESNWNKLMDCIPEVCEKCSFYPIDIKQNFPESDLIIFTSMQNQWWKWNSIAKSNVSGLIVHNGNMYFRPLQNVVSAQDTQFTKLKFYAKWAFEYLVNYTLRKKFLQAQDFVFPFSPTQLNFFQEHCTQNACLMPVSFNAQDVGSKQNIVILYLYNQLRYLDKSYFQKCLSEYTQGNYEEIHIICTTAEYSLLKSEYSIVNKVKLHSYPLKPKSYYELLQRAKYVCLPFQQERIFNIFREQIGITKYSGRIRDALEHGCELHMPDYIPREDPNAIPGLEEAARLMEEKLHEMYKLATS